MKKYLIAAFCSLLVLMLLTGCAQIAQKVKGADNLAKHIKNIEVIEVDDVGLKIVFEMKSTSGKTSEVVFWVPTDEEKCGHQPAMGGRPADITAARMCAAAPAVPTTPAEEPPTAPAEEPPAVPPAPEIAYTDCMAREMETRTQEQANSICEKLLE